MRWRPIYGAALAGVLALAAGVAFTVGAPPEPAPYTFLEGRTPVEVEWATFELDEMDKDGREVTVYSFRGDSNLVYREVSAELRSYYRPWRCGMATTSPPVYFDFHSFSPFTVRGSAPPPPNTSVRLVEDARPVKGALVTRDSLLRSKKPGWVTVVVDRPRVPTTWDRFRSWLGL